MDIVNTYFSSTLVLAMGSVGAFYFFKKRKNRLMLTYAQAKISKEYLKHLQYPGPVLIYNGNELIKFNNAARELAELGPSEEHFREVKSFFKRLDKNHIWLDVEKRYVISHKDKFYRKKTIFLNEKNSSAVYYAEHRINPFAYMDFEDENAEVQLQKVMNEPTPKGEIETFLLAPLFSDLVLESFPAVGEGVLTILESENIKVREDKLNLKFYLSELFKAIHESLNPKLDIQSIACQYKIRGKQIRFDTVVGYRSKNWNEEFLIGGFAGKILAIGKNASRKVNPRIETREFEASNYIECRITTEIQVENVIKIKRQLELE